MFVDLVWYVYTLASFFKSLLFAVVAVCFISTCISIDNVRYSIKPSFCDIIYEYWFQSSTLETEQVKMNYFTRITVLIMWMGGMCPNLNL